MDKSVPDPFMISAPGGGAEGREERGREAAGENAQLVRNHERRRVKTNGGDGDYSADEKSVKVGQKYAESAGGGDPAAVTEQRADQAAIVRKAPAQHGIEP